jgi:hypothetical protein
MLETFTLLRDQTAVSFTWQCSAVVVLLTFNNLNV